MNCYKKVFLCLYFFVGLLLFSTALKAQQTATITGTISYQGVTSTGTFYIWASTQGPFGEPMIGPEPGPFGYLVVVSSDVEGNNVSFNYELKVYTGYTYWIMVFRDHHSPFIYEQGENPMKEDPRGIYSFIGLFVNENKSSIDITLNDPTPIISGSVVYDGRYGVKVGSMCYVYVTTSTAFENGEVWSSIVAAQKLEIIQAGSYSYKFYAEDLRLHPPASYYVFVAYDAEAPYDWFYGGGPSVGDIISFYGGKLDTTKTPFEWILQPTPIYLESEQQQISNINIILDTEVLGWQYGYITGKVTSAVDGSMLSGTVIQLLKNNNVRYITACNEQGEYSLIVVQGTYDVKASSLGYLPHVKPSIQIPIGSTTTVNFSLSKPLKISGTVSYNGLTQNATFYIWVSTQQQYGQPAVNVYNQMLLISTFVVSNSLNYEYSFENLEPYKNYWVMAFRDVNPPYLNLQQPQQNPLLADPIGAYENNPIYLDSDKLNINFTITDPPPTGSIEGQINYAGEKRKELIIALFDNPNLQGGPVYFVSLGTPTSYPHSYQLTGLPIGNTYYLVATMVSGWTNEGPLVLKEDPWYIHGDTSTWPPQLLYMIPILSEEPIILNFELIDEDNPFAPKPFEAYGASYHYVFHSLYQNQLVEIHNYSVSLGVKDNFRSARKVEVKGPGFEDGNTFVEIYSSGDGMFWSTNTFWNVPPNELPSLPLNYIIKITTDTESEGLEFQVSIDTFIPIVQLLTPQPFTNISSLTTLEWTSAGENKIYDVTIYDLGDNFQQSVQIFNTQTATTQINYTGPSLNDRHYYELSINVRDNKWNGSFNRFRFSYNAPATKLLIVAPQQQYEPRASWQGKVGEVSQQTTLSTFTVTIYAVNNAWIVDNAFNNQITLTAQGQNSTISLSSQATNGVVSFELLITTPGWYNFYAYGPGISSPESVNIYILDVSSPTAFNLSYPEDGKWLNTNWVYFQWEPSYDNSGWVKYQLWINNELKVDNIYSNGYSYYLDEGSYNWYIVAVDNNGYSTKSNQTWTFHVDTTPPSGLTVIQPDKSYISTNNVIFSWQPPANEQNLDKYILRIKDINYNPVLEAEFPVTQTSTTVFLNEGSYYFSMEVYDKAENSYSTFSWGIIIDTTPPQGFSLFSPQNNSYEDSEVSFQWTTVYDSGSGVEKYQLYLNDELKADNIQINSVQLNLDEGVYSWYVKAIDRAGNETRSNETWTVTVDTTGPTVKITYPQNNSYLETLEVISGTAADLVSGVDKVELVIKRLSDDNYWNGVGWYSYYSYVVASFEDGIWSYDARSIGLTNNTSYYIFASAVDKAGNYNDEDDVVLFTYTEMGYIAGKVTSTVDGSALAGAIVGVFEQGELKFTTVCDENGEYSIKVPVGTYNVGVSSYGYMPDLKTGIEVTKNSTTTVNFSLEIPVGYIAGQIKNTLDTPLQGALVEIFVGENKIKQTIADEEGKYSVELSTLNIYKVKVSSSGYASKEETNKTVAYKSTTTVNFTLIDITSPTAFSLTSPQNNSWFNRFDGNWINLQWSASYDNSGFVRYNLYVNDQLKEENLINTSVETFFTEGSYEWYVEAVDNDGNKTISNQKWILNVDTTPPSNFTINYPQNDSYRNTNNVEFSWNASYDVNLLKYRLFFGPNNYYDVPATQTSTTVFLNQGVYWFQVIAIDKAGNINVQPSTSWKVTIDTTPPLGFSLFAPDDGSFSAGVVDFYWWAADDVGGSGIAKYKLYLNNVLAKDNIVGTWTNMTLPEGEYSWYVKAVDKAGNETNSLQTWTVKVDTTPPVVKITYPSNNSYVDTLDIISGTAFDTVSGIKEVKIRIERLSDGKKWDNTYGWVDVADYFSVSYENGIWSFDASNVELTADTSYYIRALARDNALYYSNVDLVLFRCAEMGYIAGKVTSTVDGSALAGAIVGVFEQGELKFTTVCDENGEYSIKVPVGTYNVGVSSYGYMPDLKEDITVAVNATTTVNFSLDLAAGWIAGRVKNTLNQSLVGSLIEVFAGENKVAQVVADDEGEYSILVATMSVYRVKVSSYGYGDKEENNIVVEYRSTTTVNFTLIDITSPTAFSLISPLNSSWVNTNEVEFSWEASFDNQTGLKKYILYVENEIKEDNISPTQTSTTTYISNEGSYSWYVVAEDNEGNRTKSNVWWVGVDVSPPSNVVINPEDVYTKGTSNTISWQQAQDTVSGVKEYIVNISSSATFSWYTEITTNQTSYEFTDLEDAVTYYYRVKAKDNAGNLSPQWSDVTWSVQDATPPSEFSLKLSSGIINTNTITFEWEASNDTTSGLSRYQLYINDYLVYSNISPTKTSTTTFIPEGEYSWYVVAVDNVGNERKSKDTWTIKVDTTPPKEFSLLSPSNESYNNTNNITFSWSASQDTTSGLSKYVLYINQTSYEILPVQTSTTVFLSEGAYEWYVKAIDNAGHIRETDRWSLVVDTTPPSEFSLVSPLNSSWYGLNYIKMDPITLVWEPSNDSTSGIAKYQLVINNQLVIDNIPFNYTNIDFSSYEEGEYSWYVKAIDRAGNENISKEIFIINIDTTPPVVSIIYPPNRSFIDSLESIHGTAEDLGIHRSGVEGSGRVALIIKRLSDNQYWNGTGWQSAVTAEYADVLNGNWSYDATTLAQNLDINVSYEIEVVVRDNADNFGEHIISTFTYVAMGYISGRVMSDVDGSVLAGAMVGVFQQGDLKFSTVCDENGEYSIKLPVGIYDVGVSSYGYMSSFETGIEVLKNSTSTVNFSLDLAVGWLAGKVENTIQTPLQGALVEIFAAENKVKEVLADEWGRYSVLLSTLNVYKIRVSADGYATKEETNKIVEYRSTTTVNFTLIDITSPSAFSLISPSNGSWFKTTDISFSWQHSIDYQTGRKKYEFYINGPGLNNVKYDVSASNDYLNLDMAGYQGYYYWYVVVEDNDGNRTTSNVRGFGIDTTPPEVPGVVTGPKYVKGTSNTILWDASQDNLSGISVYRVEVSTNEDFSSLFRYTETTQTSATFIELEEAITYYYRVKAKDKAGNESEWSNVIWSIQDATLPESFSLIATSGVVNTNDVILSWQPTTDSISGLAVYQLWINNELFDEISATDNITSFEVNLPEGEHSWYIKAVDYAGNERQSNTTFTVKIDTTAPTISITTPQNNSDIAALTVISGTVSDAGVFTSGVNNVKLTIKRLSDNYTWTGSSWSANQHSVLATINLNVWSYTGLTTSDLTLQTSYYVIATAKDNAKNEATALAKFTYVSIEAPKGTISGYVRSSYNNEPLMGAVVEVLKDNDILSTAIAGNDGSYSVLIETGVYKVRASSLGYSVAEYDNVIVASQQISTVNFILIDITSPSAFSLISPPNNSLLNTNYIEFSWNASYDKETGLLCYQLYINGQLVEDNIAPQKTSTTTFVSESENISWYVVAVDKVGNKTQTGAWQISVDTTAPSLASSYPQNNSIVDVTISSVVFMFSEDINTSLDVRDAITMTNYSLDNATLTWVNDKTLVVILSTALNFGTTYQITLNPQNNKLLKDKAGNALPTTTIVFATKAEEIEIKLYSIKGYIKTEAQNPISNVKVSIRKETETTPLFIKYTDLNGYYEFLNLEANETYVVEPYKINYTFTPSSITIYLNENKDEVNFIAIYSVEEQKQIDVPLGLDGTPVTMELPKVSDVKIIIAESQEKSPKAKGTINPEKGESVGIVFNPGKNPQDYINKEFKIKIFTLTGELVEELTKVPQTPDDVWIKWSPKNLASGTYIIYVQGPNVKVYKRIVILR